MQLIDRASRRVLADSVMSRSATARLTCAVAVATALAALQTARADDPPPTEPSASAVPSNQLAEIVVTATRRTTTVQTTPISITAFTAAQIASRGIVDSDSLASSVPGIAVRNTGGPGEEEFEIRG